MPDPDHSPDAGTELLSMISYRLRNFAGLAIGCQRAAPLRRILRQENPTLRIGGASLVRASRGFKMVLFTEPSEDLCRRSMRSTECPSIIAILSLLKILKYQAKCRCLLQVVMLSQFSKTVQLMSVQC